MPSDNGMARELLELPRAAAIVVGLLNENDQISTSLSGIAIQLHRRWATGLQTRNCKWSSADRLMPPTSWLGFRNGYKKKEIKIFRISR